jgi:hypothetical protein
LLVAQLLMLSWAPLKISSVSSTLFLASDKLLAPPR